MLRVKLNSAKSGVLYHYTDKLENITSILDNGLRTSTQAESHMIEMSKNPRIKNKISKLFAEKPESAFVSLSRTPLTMPIQGKDTGAWRYGVIFSAEKLSQLARIMPYLYNASNHEFKITVTELEDDPGGFMYSTDTSGDKIVHSKGEDPTPLDKFLDVFYELADDPNCPLTLKEYAGEWTISATLTPEYSFKDLPKLIQNMLTTVAFESEDRAYFPEFKPEQFVEDTKDAIIGVIVPDTEYYTKPIEAIRQKYPYPMYAYRDPLRKLSDTDERPPKEAYQYPTY